MTACIVFTRNPTSDAAELALYAAQAPTIKAGQTGGLLASFCACEALEGPAVEGVALLDFETADVAPAWYPIAVKGNSIPNVG